MATKTSVSKSSKSPKSVKTPLKETPQKEYVELKLPKLPQSSRIVLPLLGVVLLLIGAYFLGMQTAKVKYLEGQLTNQTTTGDTSVPQTSPTPVVKDVGEGALPVLGNKNAPVTIVEFSDFQCPFCKRFTDEAFQKIKTEYIDTGKVKYAFRHYPLPIHPNAPKAAEASECANEQNAFWKYHDILFENQDTWANLSVDEAQNEFVSYAGNLGLDTTQFGSCLSSGKYADKVAKDTKAAQDAQVSATPTAYINGQQVVGALPFDAFKTIIDEQLK